jgi:thiol-disulfide isomerase/thioredoxin
MSSGDFAERPALGARGASPRCRCRAALLAAAALCIGLAPRIEPAMAAPADASLDLAALRGEVVYLDFWASWCGPCRLSFPWMQQMQDTYAQQGLKVIAVDVDHDRRDAERFLAAFHPSFDVRFDPTGTLAERFKVQGMPTGLVIDRRGVVRYTHIGFRPVDKSEFEGQLRQLLNDK